MSVLVQSCKLVLCTAVIFVLVGGLRPARAQQTPDPHEVPVMDGEAGPCSVGFTVTDVKGDQFTTRAYECTWLTDSWA
jgi:hypothetical protein